jgi:hypothetical protein
MAENHRKRWDFQGFGANLMPNAEGHLGNVGLKALPPVPAGPDLAQLVDRLSQRQHELVERFQRDFRTQLQAAAEEAKLPLRLVNDQLTVGPFVLHLNSEKETSSLEYAKVVVSKDLPLDPAKIVAHTRRLVADLLTPPADLRALAAEVEEALRVVLARQKKSLAADEWRGELPAVYRELFYIRQGRFSVTARKSLKEYPLARFMVEVKTLVQSDESLAAARRFRLEPAVIENTKNPNKSVFFPNDLSQGFGEGMYFQALIMFAGG